MDGCRRLWRKLRSRNFLAEHWMHSAQWAFTVSLSIRTIMLWDCSCRIMVIILPLIAFYMAAVFVGSAWHLKVVWSEHAFAQPRFIVTLLAVVCLRLNGNLGMVIGVHVVPSTVTVISSPSVAPRFSLIDQQIVAGRAVRHLYKYAGPVPETSVESNGDIQNEGPWKPLGKFTPGSHSISSQKATTTKSLAHQCRKLCCHYLYVLFEGLTRQKQELMVCEQKSEEKLEM
ncbi:hypothetical protein C8J56DRAFT_880983 [Mycena floridula]|nr:hypothetical protein C8J56DRAFT_880983 [Mycena floridula]